MFIRALRNFGPVIILGEGDNKEYVQFDTTKYDVDNITLNEACGFLTRDLGSGIIVKYGRNGFYIKKNSEYYNFIKDYDRKTLTKKEAEECIKDEKKVII